MKLKEIARTIWRDFEALAYALDYDQRTDLSLRIEQLELDGQSRETDLMALSERVRVLTEQVSQLAGTRG